MKNKKSLVLSSLLSIFIIALSFIITFNIDYSNNKKINVVVVNDDLLLGDTCSRWGAYSSKVVEKYTGKKCPDTLPTTGTATEYECYTEKGNSKKECNDKYDSCYKVVTYKRNCSGSATGTGDKTDDEKKCSAGQKLVDDKCVNCEDGKWSNGGTVTSCSSCPAGYACKDGKKIVCNGKTQYSKSGAKQCSYCTAGEVNENHTECKAKCQLGYFYDRTTEKCKLCDDTDKSYQDTLGTTGCKQCPLGKKANADRTGCIDDTSSTEKCSQGEYFNPVNNKCSPCPTGQYQDQNNYSKTYCMRCPAGTYQDKTGQSSCISCSGYSKYQDQVGMSSCKTCINGEKANSDHTGCQKSNGSTQSSDKCYKDSTGNYVVGNFNNQAGYTLVGNTTKNCNNIKVKKVDDKKTILNVATISFTDTSNPANNKTLNIGQTEISLLEPGSYKIVETVAPSGYQLDNTEIKITVNTDGTINIIGGTNIDLGITNGTRNIDLSIINKSGDTDGQCYVKRGMGTYNEYCFGDSNYCSGYTEVVAEKNKDTCYEDDACYQLSDGSYIMGKYNGQNGYTYTGTTCPACYKNSNGVYRWTNSPTPDEVIMGNINSQNNCVSSSKSSGSKIIYIILIIIVAAALYFVLKSLKNNKNNNNQNDGNMFTDY